MKICTTKKNQYKLLKLKLVKTKIYKKTQSNLLKLEDIIHRIKKALNIIYKYHANNKRILFIGTPIQISDKVKHFLKNTKHISIAESVWMNGLFTNPTACFNYISKNKQVISEKISNMLFQMKNQSDLIVILNQSTNINALNESYTNRVPVISLNHELTIIDLVTDYKVPGSFQFTKKKVRENFFYSLLLSIFKKANKDLRQMKLKAQKQKALLRLKNEIFYKNLKRNYKKPKYNNDKKKK